MTEENIPKAPKNENFYQWIPLNKEWEEKDFKSLISLPESPFPSWVWNENTVKWEAPIIKPENPKNKNNWVEQEYKWEEDTLSWQLVSTKPFPSWIKTTKGWKAPVDLPENIKNISHYWDENEQNWFAN